MNLKLERIKRNMNQKEFSKLIGIGVNSLVKLEKGDYSTLKYPLMIKISKVLDLTAQELFF